MDIVPMEDFGKDHWSLLGYFETLCVDSVNDMGKIDMRRVRCNTKTHPHYSANHMDRLGPGEHGWKPEYGTRLHGYFLEGKERDKSRQIQEHDDWDCFEDLIKADLVTWEGTGTFPHVKFTEKGLEIAAELRVHKAIGGVFAHFRPGRLSSVQGD